MRNQKAKHEFSQACQNFCSQDVPFCVAEENNKVVIQEYSDTSNKRDMEINEIPVQIPF